LSERDRSGKAPKSGIEWALIGCSKTVIWQTRRSLPFLTVSNHVNFIVWDIHKASFHSLSLEGNMQKTLVSFHWDLTKQNEEVSDRKCNLRGNDSYFIPR
jgi:hypothetical protein